MIHEIRRYGDPVLRAKAAPITEITDSIRVLAQDMIETMRNEPGVGLAAPQIGQSVRLIVFELTNLNIGSTAYINPEIIETQGSIRGDEGCLSVPGIYETVTRSQWIKLKTQTLEGEEIIAEYSDMSAVVLQHEIDHINGILFIDHLNSLKRTFLSKKLKKISSQPYM
ncbi:MAG: peptide deformylase [Candidatus Ancaeobacter aquaticus]|nr:peptide deformylase [Candidatus Ancaeobacter aquaticus]